MTNASNTPSTSRTYQEKLRDPKWLNRKKQILNARGHQCESCGARRSLEVHHGYYAYWLEPWEYEDATLWILCRDCHEVAHESLAVLQRQIGLLNPAKLNARAAAVEKDEELKLYLQQMADLSDAEEDVRQQKLASYQSIELRFSTSISPDLMNRLKDQYPGLSVVTAAHTDGDDYVLKPLNSDAREEEMDEIHQWLCRVI